MAPRLSPARAAALQAAVVALAVAGAAAVGWAASRSQIDPPDVAVVALPAAALVWVLSGVVAWRQRPRSRIGPMMALVGLTALVSGLVYANDSAASTAGALLSAAYIGVFAHVLLAFPSGRLPSRAAAWLVGLIYLDVTALKAISPLFDRELCDGCPPNAILLRDDLALDRAFGDACRAFGIALALAGIAFVLARWRGASPALRRAVAPVLWSGGAAIVAIVVALVLEWHGDEGAASILFHGAFGVVPLAFLVGVARDRLARDRVAGLVVELGAEGAPGTLRDVLARALHDPTLQLAYWRDEPGGFVDLAGHAVTLPGPGEARASTLVERSGRPVAALVHDPTVADDPALVRAACAAAGLALENERLAADLRARLDDLRASRTRIVEAADAERRRVERNLHDGAQQRLVSVSLALGLAERRLAGDPDGAVELLREARASLGTALGELRELSQGIHPAILTERGLAAALRELSYSAAVPVALDVELPGRLPEPVEAATYYLVAEALANVGKHAHAVRATVAVRRENGCAEVRVADDGVGGADPAGGSGLRGLVDRVEALGGRLAVASPPGGGTEVRAVIPCA
ncbi:MAG: histidine kinase [Thermoleophilia bacterium]